MLARLAALVPPLPHYPRSSERTADGVVHAVGLVSAALGGGLLLGLAFGRDHPTMAIALAVYAVSVMLMFACSAAYNFAGERTRPWLRRLDHAAIFIMIAGSYTPFTTLRLRGAWALGMTGAVWGLAATAALAKLFAPGLDRRLWIGLYLAFGWIALFALKPLLATVSLAALVLLVVGGLVYSAGVLVYLRRNLPYRRAIWHGFVVAAAGVHYAAIMLGVVLAPPPGLS